MKINFQSKIVFILLVTFQFSVAQKKEENIGTEVVNVVKPYTPTISDAFKVKETPIIEDEINVKKEPVKYSIFSFPVASTFTPSKGKAEGVEKTKQDYLYKNYATLGYGNYETLNAELFVTQNISNTEYVGGMFRHHSSQGRIKGVELNDNFYDTSLDLSYGLNQKELSWKVNLGYQNQIYNWYGLPTDFGKTLIPTDRAILINKINPQQSYNSFTLASNIEFTESIFSQANLKLNHFSDAYGSTENRFYIKPTFQVDIMDTAIKTTIIVDYLDGSFKKNYSNTNSQSIKYGFTNFGVAPSFVMLKDDWTLNIGVALFYSLDNQNSNNRLLIYPKISASYKVVGDLMIFYAGAEGNLEQNSYMNFVNENPYVSPTLNISPTDKQFDIYAGLKGKLASSVSYTIRASYLNERDKALFKSNDFTENSTNENYAFGNSLQVVYDDMKTMSFYGELKADFSDKVTFGVNGTFSAFTNNFQAEAWNLPAIKLNSKLDIAITEKLNLGFNVFFVGERKDQKINTDIIYLIPPSPNILDSYFDLNAHFSYKYSDRLTAFLRANNIANQGYQKWLNYPVQSFQIVLGANYKFDF